MDPSVTVSNDTHEYTWTFELCVPASVGAEIQLIRYGKISSTRRSVVAREKEKFEQLVAKLAIWKCTKEASREAQPPACHSRHTDTHAHTHSLTKLLLPQKHTRLSVKHGETRQNSKPNVNTHRFLVRPFLEVMRKHAARAAASCSLYKTCPGNQRLFDRAATLMQRQLSRGAASPLET